MKKIYPLRNPIREYAWGSRTAIPELLGRPPSDAPQAELWLGAHPSAPSQLEDAPGVWRPLDRWISDPGRAGHGALDSREAVLGPKVAARWRNLPFLLKVLAAARPLSIQAHPDAEQARRGFAEEEAAGVPRDAPERNYPDDRHKPELIYALTPFTVLRGFREPTEAKRRFERVGLGKLPFVATLDARAAEEGLQTLLRSLLAAPADEAERWVETALGEIDQRGADDETESWLPRLAEEYGPDRGVLGPLFLHVFRLEPGEALFTGAGVLHAYLGGLGVEVMAGSDNVLRGGLTAKHVDPAELARVVRYEVQPPARTEGVTVVSGVGSAVRFDTPADDFRLALLRPEGGAVDVAGGVQILLCTEGSGEILVGGDVLAFQRGDSFFVPHATGPYRLRGEAAVFRASVGL